METACRQQTRNSSVEGFEAEAFEAGAQEHIAGL